MKLLMLLILLSTESHGYDHRDGQILLTLNYDCKSLSLENAEPDQAFNEDHPMKDVFHKFDECERNIAFYHLSEGAVGRKGLALFGMHLDTEFALLSYRCEFEVIKLLPKDHPIWSEFSSAPDTSNSSSIEEHEHAVLFKYDSALREHVKFICPQDLNS